MQGMLEAGDHSLQAQTSTLVDIAFELVGPFQELRAEARPPTVWFLPAPSKASLPSPRFFKAHHHCSLPPSHGTCSITASTRSSEHYPSSPNALK